MLGRARYRRRRLLSQVDVHELTLLVCSGRSGCGAVAEGCDIDLARRGRSKSNNTLYYVRLLIARSLVCEYVCVCASMAAATCLFC